MIASKFGSLFFLTTVAVCFTCLLSCEDSPTSPPPGFEQFPFSVGSSWQYERYDSLGSSLDTLLVSVTDTITLPNGVSATIWVYVYPDSIDSNYVTVVGDTAFIYDVANTFNARAETFIYPLLLGKEWDRSGGVNIDQSEVLAIDTAQVPAGTFASGAKVSRVCCVDFEGGRTYTITWLVDGIGIVYRYQFIRWGNCCGDPFDISNETWKLLSYVIVK